ncbi:tail fiber protein [Bradyrhizobium sp. NP1]|uniref:phage tail protein n=1 Tax=Bradyrhizobium sp. NP1 TaxID=3049772 RepID=UPI0025A65424|nr:tail fiber protein [Bradyrhizobium sp. NP1]WJR81878.1 tail fiber protein [Bradyrhizobium sp. NP1]
MTLYKWSQTASLDASADSTINWAEGQAPSSINDSARAMMAATAKYRDDISGAIVTSGTSTAYAVSSYQQFDTLTHLGSQMIAFTPHTTNTAGTSSVTLNVDGLGAKPLRSAPNTDLLAGVLVQGSPYVAVYNANDGAFYLQGFYGASPYLIPIGAGLDYWGATTPNSSFAFPTGQAISRTTYAVLFAIIGTTYGPGDGSTTFNLPDKTGRVSAMKEASSTRLTSSYFGGNSTSLGATGGVESHTLTSAEMPSHNHGVTDPGHTHGVSGGVFGGTSTSGASLNNVSFPIAPASIIINNATTGITINNAGSGNAHAIVQPTIVSNYIMRII